ncbi:cob(I)yrinic acid a,c-diamide adenosyltransferase [Anaeromusa acidaminophila]|uniref:cob(I)yrinic acid a,c-diamide adenosyltransferase n=1 Tax=Anaeromusa acidaminophila TaxID=81464 RepID=UPI000360B41C|nr:cob(I)yrinic acid a,c-diamide adenosyltransferase [Anaeromusa acidaminophila]
MKRLGLIQVYTGDGKGKTTAALGLALRAWGKGWRIAIVQFMKDDPEYGEVKALQELDGIDLFPVGRNDFVNLDQPEEIDRRLARQGWELARSFFEKGDYEMVVLDEINIAVACGLLAEAEVVAALWQHKKRPQPRAEIVMTGRYATPGIMAEADLITEMKELRHPFVQGIEMREGIDH